MNRVWKALLIVCVAATFAAGFARPSVAGDAKSYQFWIDLNRHWYINNKAEFYGDYGYRIVDYDTNAWRLYGRPSVRYHINKQYEAQGGVGVFYTSYEYQSNRLEIRPFQAFVVRWPNFELLSLQSKFRLEERFYYFIDDKEWEFNLRFRYQIATNLPLKRGVKENFFFVPLKAEWFWDIGDEVYDYHPAEMRFDTGLGYVFKNFWTLEFHFIFQRSRSGADDTFKIDDLVFRLQIKWLLSSKDNRSNE